MIRSPNNVIVSRELEVYNVTDVSLATGACIKYQKEIVAVFVSGLHASLLIKITFFIYPI